MGTLEVICGPMFSGKTEELIRRVTRAVIARRKVQVFKPRPATAPPEQELFPFVKRAGPQGS